MKPSNYSEPVQLIAFVLQKGAEWNPDVLSALEGVWGPIRHKGKLFSFDRTSYYEPEMGTELYLNTYLAGDDGYRIYQADKNGYILPGMKEETKSAENGSNVYTTLDQDIQEALECLESAHGPFPIVYPQLP